MSNNNLHTHTPPVTTHNIYTIALVITHGNKRNKFSRLQVTNIA